MLLVLAACTQDQRQGQGQTRSEAVSQTRSKGDDWPRFLGQSNDGTSQEEGVDPDRWEPHPPIKWSVLLGTSYGGPTIVGSRLLQFDKEGADERVVCYDANDGSQLWHWRYPIEYADMYGYNSGPRCSPIVDENRVYAYGVAGDLTCLDLETGKLVWHQQVSKKYGVVQNFFGVASTPIVYEDLLLVMVGGSPSESQHIPAGQLQLVKPNGTAIVALDKRTGEEKYRVGDELASYSSVRVVRIHDQDLGLALVRGGLLAWEPRTGKQIFHFPWRADMLESVNAALPVVFNNQILVSEAYEIGSALLELDSSLQPQVLWQDQAKSRNPSFRAHWSTPVLIDGYLYGCSGRNQPDSDFRCIRWSDGELMWRQRQHERSSVLLVDGYLVVLGEYGRLSLVRPNPESYETLREVDLSEIANPETGEPWLSYPCWAAPVLSHGLLYVRGDTRLICMELIPE